MNKLLVLVACVLGTVSAGRIFPSDNRLTPRIERMPWQSLVRQKFLLDIVRNVQEPLQQTDLLQLDQGLITDENRYAGGVNEQIQTIIDMDRQRSLVTRNQIFNIRNIDHVQQLRGISSLLARSIDFETLQRNAVYLRRNVNPVLFVSALTWALQSRQDSQKLIMPATLEILPELCLDEEIIGRVQRTQRELEMSPRRSFGDLFGLGQRQSVRGISTLSHIIMPWRQQAQVPNRVVLSQRAANQDDISVLTEDIGMRNFINTLVQQLAMTEDVTQNRMTYLNNDYVEQMERRRQQQQNEEQLDTDRVQYERRNDNDDDDDDDMPRSRQIQMRRVQLERNMGRGIERMSSSRRGINSIDQLPTVSINDARLLRVGRRRQQNMNRINMNNDEDRLDTGNRIESLMDIVSRRDDSDEDTLNEGSRYSTYRNRIQPEVDISDALTLDDIVEMIRRESRARETGRSQRYRRSLDIVSDESSMRRSEMLLHTLRQLLARLNQERIALRLSGEQELPRIAMPSQDQEQRYALRLNEMRLDSRRNRALITQLNAIENTLQLAVDQVRRERNNLSMERDTAIRVERALAEVVLGRLGDTGILRLLREQLQDGDRRIDSLDLGIDLNDRVLRYTLTRILSIVDEQRVQQLGVYDRQQLELQDVAINDVRVSELRTRLEDVDMDVSQLLEQPQQMQMLVRQRRLNNRPFTIDLEISSQRAQNVIIRLMMGPREGGSLEQRRQQFVLLEAINVPLQAGRNRIQQRSTNIGWTTRDVTPISEIYRRVMSTMRGQREELLIDELVGETGRFPQRLLLPRGRREGLPMQLLVIVSPIERRAQIVPQNTAGMMGISVATIEDGRSLGYPLDRRIDNEEQLLRLPNVYMQDVLIVQEN
ncbi:hypothetical protein KR093_005559 [Drosophila rubida]|uniref:Fat-body protein 1 n=1 Tax=Drosophila rubida TaxID=30044 RepID=A0AAD4PL91_9MUSC|nr:hypothetical protein KR093_005559 [Drosophila rubida]